MQYIKHSKIEHLSDNQVTQLLVDYYHKKSISDILKSYKIDIKPSSFSKILPSKETSELCPVCGNSLQEQYLSRTSRAGKTVLRCSVCNHEPYSENCSCEECKKAKREKSILIEQQKQEEKLRIKQQNETFIKDCLTEEIPVIDIKSLSLEEKVYMGAIMRGGIDEGYNYIKPIVQFDSLIAPTEEFAIDIVKMLKRKNIIRIHPKSDMECFGNIDIEKETYSYYIGKVYWKLNLASDGVSQVSLVDSLINPNKEVDVNEAYLLWKKIALNESIQYLLYSIKKTFNVSYNVGDKTIGVLMDLLNDYSVGQIYYIIYNSVNKALRFSMDNQVNKNHAVNTIVGCMQSLGERAKNKKWNLENYSRIGECPQSLVSKFFFERILKIDDKGFTLKPQQIYTN